MPLPGALTLTTLSGTYTAPDGTPLGGQLTFTPSSALTNESGHPVLAATPLTVRLAPGTGSFSISLLNTDNALLPDTWMWHVIVAVPGAQESYFFGLPSTLGPATDINTLTPVSPPPSGASFVSSINGQTGDVILADGFGILPPAGDLGGGTTLAPQVTATHLTAPLPIAQGGTGAASGSAALAALGGISAASPAFTGTPTAPTASALTDSTQIATTAYADSAVAAEASRAGTAEGLKLAKASNLSDVANAATARGNLGAQGVRTPTAVKTGTSYTAVAGDFARIDSTAGAYTVTLPAAPADKTVIGVKLVASAASVNAVTIARGGSDTFNVSGGTTLTLKLLNQGVLLQYDTAATAWDVHSDDLPLGGLDTRYANVFSPMAYGAKGDGTTDDTTAVRAAFTAAGASSGVVDLGAHLFLTSSAITLHSNITVTGAALLGSNGTTGTITNSTSDIFTVGAVAGVEFRNVGLVASAGHVFNATSCNCSLWRITGTYIKQSSASHAIWYMPSGAGLYIDMLVGDGSILICSSTASIAPWYMISSGGINGNTWRRMTFSGSNNPSVPLFYIENTNATSSAFGSDAVFRDIVAEECPAGIIQALSVQSLTIENVQGWDAAFTGDLFFVGTSSTGGQPSNSITARNSGRRGAGALSGLDFHATADTTGLILENVGPAPASLGTLGVSVPQSTVIVPAQAYVPASFLNSATGGSSGTTVTGANSGGSSGTAFSGVSGTVTFDNTEPLPSGTSPLAYKLAGSGTAAYVKFLVPNSVFPSLPQYSRTWVYFSGTPFTVDVLSSTGLTYRLSYTSTTGFWYVRAFPGGTVSGITGPAANTWYRVETEIRQATGTITARIYNLSGVLLETITGTGGTTTSNVESYYGSLDSFTGTMWMAYPAWSNAGWVGGGGGPGNGVTSVTAGDGSVVVGGTASAPTLETGTLDVIAAAHPPAAAVGMNSQKITGVANGTAGTDAAAFGQIPALNYGGVFGDGSDGGATLDGTATVGWASKSGSTYIMSRDAYLTSLTISSGVTLKIGNTSGTASWKICCTGTVTNGGTISGDGVAASGTTAGTGLTSGSLAGSAAGGASATGAGGNGGGANSAPAGYGMASGGAGGAGASGAAGNGGAATSASTSQLHAPQSVIAGVISLFGGPKTLGGGPGGGAGGGDGTNKGGGGGGGGNLIAILAAAVVNNGTISAAGGAGGTPPTGNCGGGGGGSAGLILIFTLAAWTAGTTVVTGGAAGSAVGTGSNGNTGGAGTVLNVVVR